MRNEIQRLLARQGITFGTVLSNVFGASGMAILEALAEGRCVLEELPKLVHRSVRVKLPMLSAALEAPLADIPRYLLMTQLQRLEAVEEDIQAIERKIAAHLEPYKEKLELLQTLPGVSLTSACIILAEIGVDMTCWPPLAEAGTPVGSRITRARARPSTSPTAPGRVPGPGLGGLGDGGREGLRHPRHRGALPHPLPARW